MFVPKVTAFVLLLSFGIVSGNQLLRRNLALDQDLLRQGSSVSLTEKVSLDVSEDVHLRGSNRSLGARFDQDVRQLQAVPRVFAQCPVDSPVNGQLGILEVKPEDQFGCKGLGDLAEFLTEQVALAVGNAAPNPAEKVIQGIATPLSKTLAFLVEQQTFVPQVTICAGNFLGSDIQEPEKNVDFSPPGVCSNMPVKKDDGAEWSMFAVGVTIPPGPISNAFATACGAVVPVPSREIVLEACIAISKCGERPNRLDSAAMAISGDILGCGLSLADVAIPPIGSAIGKSTQFLLDGINGGFSLTNAFEIEIVVYNGFTLLKYPAKPTITFGVSLLLNLKKIGLKAFPFPIEFSISGQVGIALTAPDLTEEQVGDEITAISDKNQTSADTMQEIFEKDIWSVQLVSQSTFAGTWLFSEDPNLGPLLDDLDILQIGAYIYITSPTVDVIELDRGTTEKVYGGLYVFFGSIEGIAAILDNVQNFLVNGLSNVLDFLPDFFPGLTGEQLFNILDVPEFGSDPDTITDALDSFGIALTANEKRIGFYLNLPIGTDDFGYLRLNCYSELDTDDKTFYCELETANTIIQYFQAKYEIIKGKALWVWNKVNETYQQIKGPIVAKLGEIGAKADFTFNSVKEEFEQLKGIVESSSGSTLKSLQSFISTGQLLFDPNQPIGDQVQQTLTALAAPVLESLAQLKDEVDQKFNAAKAKSEEFLQNAFEKIENLDCSPTNVLDLIQGKVSFDETGCDNLLFDLADEIEESTEKVNSIINKGVNQVLQTFGISEIDIPGAIAKAGDTIIGAFTDLYNAFVDSFNDAFADGVSYGSPVGGEDEPAGYDPRTGCRLYKLMREFSIKIGETEIVGFPIPVGKSPTAQCVREHTDSLLAAMNATQDYEEKLDEYNRRFEETRDAETANNYALSNIDCVTSWNKTEAIRTEAGDSFVPMSFECTIRRINKDGTLGDSETFRSQSPPISIEYPIKTVDTYTESLGTSIAATIASTVEKEECTPSFPAEPGDGIDNDCSLVADDKSCDYNEGVDQGGKRVYQKDCLCAPPYLDDSSIESSISVSCTEYTKADDSSVPTVTEACATIFQSGVYVIKDTPVEGRDPSTTCGNGEIIRSFQFIDGFGQKSNIVVQTIAVTAEELVLDDSLLEPVKFDSCERLVKPKELAPPANVPDLLAKGGCGSTDSLSASYKDLSIAYVGCPENPATADNPKGWNVVREWTVSNKCGDELSYSQLVVVQDEIAPIFTSFPPLRVQSCRAAFDPIVTGYPVAEDNCDSVNPTWDPNLPYDPFVVLDVGDTEGCARDFTRTFTVIDRVCNSISDAHQIISTSFEFVGESSELARYDISSLIPTFTYSNTENAKKQEFFNDTLVYVLDDLVTTVPVEKCKVLGSSTEYLMYTDDQTKKSGSWVTIPKDFSESVFDIDTNDSHFSIQINEDRIDIYKGVVNESGLFRLSLECKDENKNTLSGQVLFFLDIVDEIP